MADGTERVAVLRHALSIALLPGTVTLVIPWFLLRRRGVEIGWGLPFPWAVVPPLVGGGLITVGLTLMVETIRMFGNIGKGTLAPWDPPQRLVVRGVYRHVRNPMISGVLFVLLGEAVLFGSWPVLRWFVLFAIINMTYIPLWEEPILSRRFGADYDEYRRYVPRWIPRRTPWEPTVEGGAPSPPGDGEGGG